MNKLGRELRLRDQLATVEDAYDFIVIDTPPALGLADHQRASGRRARSSCPRRPVLLAPGTPDAPGEHRGDYLSQSPASMLGILLSKLDRRLREERAVAEYLRDRWGDLVFRTEIGTNSKILEAGSAGTSVFRYAGAERAAEMYLALARGGGGAWPSRAVSIQTGSAIRPSSTPSFRDPRRARRFAGQWVHRSQDRRGRRRRRQRGQPHDRSRPPRRRVRRRQHRRPGARQSPALHRLCIGRRTGRGLGAGGDPDQGQRAAEDSSDELREAARLAPTWCSSPPAWAAAPAPARADRRRPGARARRADRGRRHPALRLRGRPPPRAPPRAACRRSASASTP